MQNKIDEVISPHILLMQCVISGKRHIKQGSPSEGSWTQRIAKPDSFIALNRQEIVKDQGDIKRVPVRDHAHQNDNGDPDPQGELEPGNARRFFLSPL